MNSNYVRLRHLCMDLHAKVMESLTVNELRLAALSLGVLKRGIYILDTEEQSNAVMDRAIYDIRERGQSAVARFLAEHAAELSEEELRVLQGQSRAWFSLFRTLSLDPEGSRTQLQDLVDNSGPHTLVDGAFSRTGKVGQLLATRLIPIDDWHMTAGVCYPFLPKYADELLAGLRPRRSSGKRRRTPIPPEDYSRYFYLASLRFDEIGLQYEDV